MKKLFIFSLILFSSVLIKAQSWIASNQIVGTDDIYVIESSIDTDGSVYVFGYFTGTLLPETEKECISYGLRDYFLIKFLSNGEIEWVKQLGGPSFEFIKGGICAWIDNNVYLSGGYREYLKYSDSDSLISTGGFDIFLAKYDKLGNLVWINNIGEGSNNQRPTALRVDNNNDILLAGFFTDSININNDTTLYSENLIDNYFFAKFEHINGDLIFAKQFIASDNTLSGKLDYIEITDENYIFSGTFSGSVVIDTDTLYATSDFLDAHIIKTDYSGNIEWIRTIKGNYWDYSFSLAADPLENIYLSGYYNSDTLNIQTSEFDSIFYYNNNGDYDMMMAKYASNGDLLWFKTNGGKGRDKIFDAKFFDDHFVVAGHFSDTLYWGGIKLISKGLSDTDMFIGNLDTDGNYRSSNSYSGRNNSFEETYSIFSNGNDLYTVMRSNSDLLVLGDSIYTSDGDSYNLYLGIIGCLPISIDNVLVNDVNTCYGDSTGSLQVLATGGFGSPYQYSIDNGLSYQADVSYFSNLPAGDYPIVVIDQKNCTQPGPVVTVAQPDTLRIELISSADITNEADGSIVVAATGGTTPYTFTLLPDNLIQGFGTYTFQPGDSGRYVVQVNDAKNCGPVETDSIDIMDFYGVGFEDISELEVRMFPNPASRMITLEMPLEEAEVTLEIMSLTGQVLISRQVYPSGGVLREIIDVSDLSRGMYMVRVDGKTLRSGIVVN